MDLCLSLIHIYGYQLDPKDKRKLIVDENVRQVVVRIFDLCIAGQSTKSIAQHLNLSLIHI